MLLKYHIPRADLLDHVRAYYYFSTDVASLQPLCAELGNIRVILEGGGFIHMPNGEKQTIPKAFLLGPTMGAYCMEATAGSRVFGVGIRPKGWLELCGISAEEATDRVIDLTALAGGMARSSIDEICNATNLSDQAAAADLFFANILANKSANSARGYSEAIGNWLLDQTDPNMDALIASMDVSRRQTDRLAKLYFGASPKFLQRKYRALRAADRIRAGEKKWMSAAGGSFYDQSHFIKEFKSFIGVTPSEFMGNQAALISEIQTQRRNNLTSIPLASL